MKNENTSRFLARWKELVLACTMLFGFVLAEVPEDIKDYTQTSARYDVDNYGGGWATTPSLLDEQASNIG